MTQTAGPPPLRIPPEQIYGNLRIRAPRIGAADPGRMDTGNFLDIVQENAAPGMGPVVRPTPDQALAHHAAMTTRRVLVEGEAGTGKSLLAREITREYARRGLRPIHLAADEARRQHASALLSDEPDVTVMTPDRLPANGSLQAIVIDDADLLAAPAEKTAGRISAALRGGLAHSRWTAFAQNTPGPAPGRSVWAAKTLADYAQFDSVELRTQTRGTRQTIAWIRENLGARPDDSNLTSGPEVKDIFVPARHDPTRSEIARALSQTSATTMQAIRISGLLGHPTVSQLDYSGRPLNIECPRLESDHLLMILTNAPPRHRSAEAVIQEILRVALLAARSLSVIITDRKYYELFSPNQGESQ